MRGFTIIELMVVVAIIAVIAAIAVPNLVSSKMTANQQAAVATLQALFIQEKTYNLKNGSYTDSFTSLQFSGFTGSQYTYQGYKYRLYTNDTDTQWWCYAGPTSWGDTGERYYFVCEQNNMIHYTDTAPSPYEPEGRSPGEGWSTLK